ncbi:MAG TPA: nucleotidyltransferase family protein [Kiloniellales bacterium]|nr:nucleotidyltransferase family protein [Kiloniellales bacterium]
MIRPTRAMLLAAGRGERMRPLSDKMPKPLLELRGRSLAERALDRLADAGVEEVVVNLHHLGEQLRKRLQDYPALRIRFTEEEELLDTGGGVAAALPLLGEEPFYVVNGDAVWLDGVRPALLRLSDRWRDEAMDALLLLHPTVAAVGYEGPGDFRMTAGGRLLRRVEREIAPFAFTGVQLVHPRLFQEGQTGAFSFNRLWSKAIEAARLFGVRHDGTWYHVGTPEALELAEEELAYDLGESEAWAHNVKAYYDSARSS